MKRLLILIVLGALPLLMAPVIQVVFAPAPIAGGANKFTSVVHHTNTSSCTNTNTCGLVLATTGTGNLYTLSFAWGSNTQTISSVACSPTCGTWVHCSNCAQNSASDGAIDAYYILSGTAATTPTVTVTFAGNDGTAVMEFTEIAASSTPVFDVSGSLPQSATLTTVPGPTLSFSGSDDYCVGMINGTGASSNANAPYSDIKEFPGGVGFAAALHQVTHTTMSWTTASGTYLTNEMCFK